MAATVPTEGRAILREIDFLIPNGEKGDSVNYSTDADRARQTGFKFISMDEIKAMVQRGVIFVEDIFAPAKSAKVSTQVANLKTEQADTISQLELAHEEEKAQIAEAANAEIEKLKAELAKAKKAK